MARFYPLYVRRSDGKLEVPVKGKRPEPNEPTTEQLDQTPDRNGVSDFYREVPLDEPKHLDWRRKLGSMLAREMNWKESDGKDNTGGYILADFPQSYRLFEHVKRTENDGQTSVKSKNHAAGGNDRQDAYLYGHPIGRKKRFRSPVDFFPHLFWLATDETGDQDNCACRYCCPEDAESYGFAPASKTKAEKPVKQEVDVKTPVTNPTPPPVARPASTQPPLKPAQNPTPPTVRQQMSSPVPQPKSTNQHIDRQFGQFMYRAGELAWFQRGPAWGLGVILRRFATPTNQRQYVVQPLSHPYQHSAQVTKTSDRELRPWLAWSVPKYTNDGLNNLPEPPRYENLDWQGVLQKRYGNGDPEVDGSILAAKAIDATYTPFGLSNTTEPEPGVTDQYFDGIYLGAEKIWVGEPIRLLPGTGTDVMVVHSIVIRSRKTNNAQQPVEEVTFLVGDLYTLNTVAHTNPSIPSPAAANNNPNLPQRLTEDLAFRNARSIPNKGVASYWKLIAPMRHVELNEIKGRWYEASLLLPILHSQATFDESARKGEISEASVWMNARHDCINNGRPQGAPSLPKPNFRVDRRRNAFGRAVPANTEIVDDMKDPSLTAGNQASGSLQIDPRFETAENKTQPTHQAPTNLGAGMDEFMNLDGMDDQSHMPGFEQQYGGQAQSRYF